MNVNKVEEYLRILEEMVMDEEKIVTFKLLSRTLDINVNTAKQLLYMYLLKQQKITTCTVSATHLLAGLSKDGTFLVSIVSDDKLDEAYKKYVKITSEHVYSLQKGKASGLEKNNQMLYVADSSLPSAKSYPIKYHKILGEKIINEPEKNAVQSLTVKTEAKFDVKLEKNKPTKQSPRKEEKQSSKKSRSISDFFNNQCQRKNLDKEEKSKKPEEKGDHEEKIEKVSKNVTKCETQDMLIDEGSKTEKADENPSSSNKSEENKRKKKTGVKKDVKKRKRILSASEDSETDEEERDILLCAEQTVSDTAETLRIDDDGDDEDSHFKNKRRRKKFVDKTVLLDDGFMETYKEVIYETDSDGESPKQKKKEAKMNFQSKGTVEKVETKEESGVKKSQVKVPAQKNNSKKQSTLFSFFKKN